MWSVVLQVVWEATAREGGNEGHEAQKEFRVKVYAFDLEDFAARHLCGNVEKLAELSLGTIQALPLVYGFSTLDSADCDDTNLVWEVYFRLWGVESIRESPPAPPDDPDYRCEQWMRGDTMNSFRTLFGREVVDDDSAPDPIVGFKGLRRFGAGEELFEITHDFWYAYHRIGNFLPLPNVKYGGKTMNTCRTAWHDYFDQFLVALHECLLGKQRANPMLMGLVDANAFFWEEYRGEAGWRRYVEKFMLEDYCDANLIPKRLYRGLWHWRRDVSHDDYVRACREYIQTATELIDRRGKRMMREVVCRGGARGPFNTVH